MKSLFVIFATLFLSVTATAKGQTSLYTHEDSASDAHVSEYKVKLVNGKNSKGSNTIIEYKNTQQLIEEARHEAQVKGLTLEQLDSMVATTYKYRTGGLVRLFVSRPTIAASDGKNFTIVVKDTTGKEVARKHCDQSIPFYSISKNTYWNIDVMSITQKVRPPFVVYVYDQKHAPLKFLISE